MRDKSHDFWFRPFVQYTIQRALFKFNRCYLSIVSTATESLENWQ